MTTYRNDLHRELHRELHELLCKEAKERRGRSDWITLERAAMLVAVNRHRARRDKRSLTVGDVERVEMMACGHTDYGTKFALYCTELVELTP